MKIRILLLMVIVLAGCEKKTATIPEPKNTADHIFGTDLIHMDAPPVTIKWTSPQNEPYALTISATRKDDLAAITIENVGETNYPIPSQAVFFKDSVGHRVGTLAGKPFAYADEDGLHPLKYWCDVNVGQKVILYIGVRKKNARYIAINGGGELDEFVVELR